MHVVNRSVDSKGIVSVGYIHVYIGCGIFNRLYRARKMHEVFVVYLGGLVVGWGGQIGWSRLMVILDR